MALIEKCIRSLNACRSEAQFDLLGSAVLDFWENDLREPKFVKYFKKIYMVVSGLPPCNAHTHA